MGWLTDDSKAKSVDDSLVVAGSNSVADGSMVAFEDCV
jgi:hypothetical protein